MSYAFVFPGQGSQYVGMGLELAKQYPEAAEVFKKADDALGRGLTKLIEEGPESDLTLTWNTQPAILSASIACLAALRSRVDITPVAVAGHSLGEFSALVAAGALEFEDAVRLVEKRGKYMQEAVPVGVGAMYAVLGLETPVVEKLCKDVSTPDAQVSIANDNCPGQIVISGNAGAAERVAAIAKEVGAKRAVQLPVSAPFHCSLMEPAAKKLEADLAAIAFKNPAVPVVANVDAVANSDAARIPELLARQVSSQVKWTDCVKTLASMGVSTQVEIGPGKVLSGLVKRIDRDINAVNIENVAGLDAFVASV